jgi:hypothetical protein
MSAAAYAIPEIPERIQAAVGIAHTMISNKPTTPIRDVMTAAVKEINKNAVYLVPRLLADMDKYKNSIVPLENTAAYRAEAITGRIGAVIYDAHSEIIAATPASASAYATIVNVPPSAPPSMGLGAGAGAGANRIAELLSVAEQINKKGVKPRVRFINNNNAMNGSKRGGRRKRSTRKHRTHKRKTHRRHRR